MKKTVAAVAGALLALSLAGPALADSDSNGVAAHSPGVLSGNVVQVPIHIPINVCGNTISVIGLLNPAAGNTCINSDVHKH
ncbi:chaplin [Streptomyces sp. NPDC047841]|uniref:chaplin n=1 Tax=Streptomyces sp. NPDC047841 TaxID=3154708 RepID=UPI00345693B0